MESEEVAEWMLRLPSSEAALRRWSTPWPEDEEDDGRYEANFFKSKEACGDEFKRKLMLTF